MKSLAIILVCAGVVAALFANQIDKVARQNNVIKTILNCRGSTGVVGVITNLAE